MKTGWDPLGRRGGSSGGIARQHMSPRFRRRFSRRKPRKSSTLGQARMPSTTIRIFGQTNSPSSAGRARPRSRLTFSTTTARTSRALRPGRHGWSGRNRRRLWSEDAMTRHARQRKHKPISANCLMPNYTFSTPVTLLSMRKATRSLVIFATSFHEILVSSCTRRDQWTMWPVATR
jgi:hypothetical protein